MNDEKKKKFTTPNNLNESVWDACEILKYLTGKDWCRLKDIAEAMEIDTAKAHRLLNTMAHHNFIQYNEDTHRYRLGFQFYTISYHMARSNLLSAAKPHLEHAAGELFETINLGMLANDKSQLVHIYRLEGGLFEHYDDVPLGINRDVNESALGKSILAFLSYGEQHSILSRLNYRRYTEHTLVTQTALEEDLKLTKDRGYAIDDFEIDDRVYCIAMPIFDSEHRPFAAVSVVMIGKPSEAKKAKVLSVLSRTVKRIAKSLGYN